MLQEQEPMLQGLMLQEPMLLCYSYEQVCVCACRRGAAVATCDPLWRRLFATVVSC